MRPAILLLAIFIASLFAALATAQNSNRPPLEADRFIFGLHMGGFDTYQEKASVSYTIPPYSHYFKNQYGRELRWKDSATSERGYLTVEGVASGNRVSIRYHGRLSTAITDSKPVFHQLGYRDGILIYPPTNARSLQVTKTLSGTITCRASVGSSSGSSSAAVDVSRLGGGPYVGVRASMRFDPDLRRQVPQVVLSRAFGSGNEELIGENQGTRTISLDYQESFSGSLPLRHGHNRKFPLRLVPTISGSGAVEAGIGQTLVISAVADKGGSAEVSFDFTVETTVGSDNQPLISDQSSVVVQKATTEDLNSIDVTYGVKGNTPANSLRFSVYRSATPTGRDVLLGEESVTAAKDLSSGKQHTVSILRGTRILSDRTKPFIVVVARTRSAESRAHFRVWRLAVFVHGYSLPIVSSLNDILAACSTLEKEKIVDKAIAFDWREESRQPDPQALNRAAARLAIRVDNEASQLESRSTGDIVEIVWAGHSRGTLLICRALNQIASFPERRKAFRRRNMILFLVDIHPANPRHDALRSTGNGAAARLASDEYVKFANVVQDADPMIPDLSSIQRIVIWWQKTNFSRAKDTSDSVMNLHGLGEPDKSNIINRSSAPIEWFDLTGMDSHSSIWRTFLALS